MLTTSDVFEVLQKSAAYVNDKTPAASEATVLAWVEHFQQFPHITRADALTAVTRYYRDPHDRMIQPADVSKFARDLHQDRALRQPSRAIEEGVVTTNEHKTTCMSEIRAILDSKRGFGASP